MKRDAFSGYHPLVNFIYFLGAIGFAVLIQHPGYIAASCIGAGIYYLLLNPEKGVKSILMLCPVFILLSAINPLFNTEGATVLFYLFGRPYTLEALLYGMATAGIFVSMMLWFGCYSKVLTSDKFTSLFGSLIPSLSLLLVMVLRMIPNFARKARQILASRKSIGKGAAENSTVLERITDTTTILSALTDWTLEGSIVTADSMRSRGYGSGKRTNYQIYRFSGVDTMILLISVVLAILTVIFGSFDASYTPVINLSDLSFGFASYCCYLSIPIVLHIKEAIIWHISVSRI